MRFFFSEVPGSQLGRVILAIVTLLILFKQRQHFFSKIGHDRLLTHPYSFNIYVVSISLNAVRH